MALRKIEKDAQGVPTGNYPLEAGGTLWADSPIGTILPYGGASAPSGWMICNGASLLRTDYPELFAVIGTAFGSADATHFNIPDLRGEFLRGAGTNSHSGQGNGGSVGEHQDATVHIHNYNVENSTTNWMAPNANDRNIDTSVSNTMYNNVSAGPTVQSATVNGARYTARPTNTSVNYIIKVKMVAMPSDFMDKVDEAILESPIVPSDASPSNKLVTADDLSNVSSDLGDKSSASAVSGNTAFAKIASLNSDLSGKQNAGHYATTSSNGKQVLQTLYTTRTGNSIAFQWVNGAIQFLIDGQIVKQI